MTNKHRGEIAATLKGEPIILRLSINSICELEEATNTPIGDIMADLSGANGSVRMTLVRRVFWAMMLDHKPEATLGDAAALLEEMNGDYQKILADAVNNTFPDPEEGAEGK